MNITMSARSTTIKDSFKASTEKKLSKLKRFFDDEATVHVTVTSEGARETVEVTIKANGMNFRSERTTGDRLDSLDAVVDALFRQIVKNKTKLEKRLRKTAFEVGYDNDFIGNEEVYNVVKTKKFTLKPMNAQEAILQMNLIGHSFYIFRNSETQATCAVYRRDQGDFGLLEPEAE